MSPACASFDMFDNYEHRAVCSARPCAAGHEAGYRWRGGMSADRGTSPMAPGRRVWVAGQLGLSGGRAGDVLPVRVGGTDFLRSTAARPPRAGF
jgi:hypothetical protein